MIGFASYLARQLYCALNSFCARVAKEEGIYRRRYDLAQFLNELEDRLMNHNIDLGMQYLTGLLLDRFNHTRMAVTRVGYSNPAGKV